MNSSTEKLRYHLLCVLILVIANMASAQIIPAGRSITWSAGVHGGIPTRTTIYKTLTTSNTLADINNAIASCPSGQVVFLSAGTYTLGGSIEMNNSGVTLRGAGPGQTILNFTAASDAGYITFNGTSIADPNTTVPANVANWTAGYAQGATQITLSNVAGISAGTMLMLDQEPDSVYVFPQGSEGCPYCGRESGNRCQLQIVTVTAVNGNVVTISPGLYMPNWASKWTPQAWWLGGPTVTMSGVEDLSMYNKGDGSYNIEFSSAQNCWALNVYSYNAGVNHFRTFLATNIEIRHCYSYGTVNAAAESYGWSPYWASDTLAEDNIFEHVTAPLPQGSCAQGNVMAYNFAIDMYYSPNTTWLIEGVSTHAGHNAFTLFEGNYCPEIYMDNIHGSSSENTAFRNCVAGWAPGDTENTFAIVLQAYNRYGNIVGNILGTAGYHNTYEWGNAQEVQTYTAIYEIGYADTSGGPAGYDQTTYNTLLRDGNYDVVTGGQVWDSRGVQTIPNSLIYSSKPSYFGILNWPPYDPSNPSANSPQQIPAGYRYYNNMQDPPPSGPTAPLPPTNLRVVQ